MLPSTATAARTDRRRAWTWLRLLGGLAILAFLAWRVGAGPFLAGLRAVDARSMTIAVTLGAVTTACAAWRWAAISAALGIRLPLRSAVAAYYRAQFLNVTLPSGLLGDVHRAVRHGRDIGDVGRGVRAVALERVAGQATLVVLAAGVLWAYPSPVRAHLPGITGVLIAVLAGLGAIAAAGRRISPLIRAVLADVRKGLRAGRLWIVVGVTSAVVLAGHLATFVVAARAAGVTESVPRLIPLTLLALLAMMLPVNVAGWGPREGVAAWAFAAAGLTAAEGVATAVTYGVLSFLACAPGALVLLAGVRRRPVLAPVPPVETRVLVGAGDARG